MRNERERNPSLAIHYQSALARLFKRMTPRANLQAPYDELGCAFEIAWQITSRYRRKCTPKFKGDFRSIQLRIIRARYERMAVAVTLLGEDLVLQSAA